tara:strand:+ start:1556 stop:1807 length:252 start_codon:yes stop_codon:yes gene_type:complete
MKDIIGNCFLCEEKALHVAGTEEAQVMQCINCGYTTTTKYIGTKETNEEFQKLGEDMKIGLLKNKIEYGFQVLLLYLLVCCIQ